MQHSFFDIYKASAGSGKTFRLTLNYLKLILQAEHAFRYIQAVTFTNKATAEMKERILEVLQHLANNAADSKTASYRSKLLEELPHLTATDLAHKAKVAYSAILHDYSRFNISTIDSFVQRIIRSFAWELGIDGGYRLQLAIDPVKEALTNKLYNMLDDNKTLLSWMTTVATERLENGKSWNIRESLMQLSGEIFKEQFSEFENSLRHKTEKEIDEAFNDLRSDVYAITKTIENKWKEEAEKIITLLEDNNLVAEDFYHKGSGPITYFYNVVGGTIEKPGSRIQTLINSPDKLAYGKASAATKAIIASIQPTIINSYEQFNTWSKTDIKPYHTADAIKKKLDELRLIKVLAEQLSDYRSEENALLMTDVHILLRELTKDSTVPFIYEKTGQQFRHYLIDEFQDTSRFQWENFLPLIQEALATNQYNMIVGDVKQAIYRWRNGDWRLLLEQAADDLKAYHPAEKTLQENYRSSRQVIAFNNLLFAVAPQLLQSQLNALIAETDGSTKSQLFAKGYDTIFERAYADAFQETPKTSPDNGMVQLSWLESTNNDSEDSEEPNADALTKMIETIEQLLEEGYSPGDMAVLVRKNEEALKVVECLIQAQRNSKYRYNVISGEALKLENNIAVKLLISCMQWLANENDSLAFATFQYQYHLVHTVSQQSNSTHLLPGDIKIIPEEWLQMSGELKGLPVDQLVHQLIIKLKLSGFEDHAAFVLAFIDVVQASMQYGEANLHSFLQYWEEEGKDKSLPAAHKSNAIEVLTIHRSKGLDFTIVLMPFIEWSLQPKSNSTYIVSASQTHFKQIPMVAIPYSQRLADTEFAPFYFEEFVLSAMDNLNMLYVAFTRARQRIYGWCKPKGKAKDKEIKQVGHLLYEAASTDIALSTKYTDTRDSFDAENNIWQYGELIAPQKSSLTADANKFELNFTDWRQKVKVRYTPLQTNDENERLLPRDQGLLLHEALHKMQQPTDLEMVLHNMLHGGYINATDKQRIKNTLQKILQLEVLQPWSNPQFKRLAEQTMLTATKEIRRADLILYSNERTIVYDFKFTENKKQQKAHEQQVLHYIEILSAIGFKNISGYLIYGYAAEAIPVNQ